MLMMWHRASPRGTLVALTVVEPNRSVLMVMPVDASARPVLVDTGVTQADWSPDGQDLCYAKTTASKSALDDSLQLGTITSRRVGTPGGQVLPKFEPGTDLAGVIMASRPETRVAYESADRVLIASVPVSLPATIKESSKPLMLYRLTLSNEPTLTAVVKGEAAALLPGRVDRFSLSPDHTKVAVPGDRGEVALIDLATGAVTPLQDEIEQYGSNSKNSANPIVPAWRNAGELSYAVPPGHPAGSSNRCEMVVATLDGSKRAISKTWPEAMVRNFLGAK